MRLDTNFQFCPVCLKDMLPEALACQYAFWQIPVLLLYHLFSTAASSMVLHTETATDGDVTLMVLDLGVL